MGGERRTATGESRVLAGLLLGVVANRRASGAAHELPFAGDDYAVMTRISHLRRSVARRYSSPNLPDPPPPPRGRPPSHGPDPALTGAHAWPRQPLFHVKHTGAVTSLCVHDDLP